MYGNRGADGYISPVALTRRLRFVPDRWEKGFSKQVQAWGSRAHFMHHQTESGSLHLPQQCRAGYTFGIHQTALRVRDE